MGYAELQAVLDETFKLLNELCNPPRYIVIGKLGKGKGMKHVHAELMMEYAKDALETDKPWERWEYTLCGGLTWIAAEEFLRWCPSTQYRRIDPYRELKEAAKNPKKQIKCVGNTWHDAGYPWSFNEPPSCYQIRDKPYTVNGVEVPVPESKAPDYGTTYFVPNPTAEDFYTAPAWRNDRFDIKWLKRGLVYLNKEDAIARAKLMLAEECRE